jgi:hypothetical protein
MIMTAVAAQFVRREILGVGLAFGSIQRVPFQ